MYHSNLFARGAIYLYLYIVLIDTVQFKKTNEILLIGDSPAALHGSATAVADFRALHPYPASCRARSSHRCPRRAPAPDTTTAIQWHTLMEQEVPPWWVLGEAAWRSLQNKQAYAVVRSLLPQQHVGGPDVQRRADEVIRVEIPQVRGKTLINLGIVLQPQELTSASR
eukprot:6213419-Pleurochrysis_carterae.AAC.3